VIARVQNYEAGTMIVTEGTNADSFYIVTKGTVEVILPRQNQSDVDRGATWSGKNLRRDGVLPRAPNVMLPSAPLNIRTCRGAAWDMTNSTNC
jgi:hypothetical protein